MKNKREMREMGEEEGLCRFLIHDNVVVQDRGILIFFLNDEAIVQDNDICFKKIMKSLLRTVALSYLLPIWHKRTRLANNFKYKLFL